MAEGLDVVPTRAHHSASRLETLDSGAILRAIGFARVSAARKHPLTCSFTVAPGRFLTARHFCCVAAEWHHFFNKLSAGAARLFALALAKVTTGQSLFAVFTAINFLWVFVTLHGKRMSTASLFIHLQEKDKLT